MTDYLRPLWREIRANFWFLPMALSILAAIGAFLVAQIDFAIQRNEVLLGVIPLRMAIESGRLALSTIAGSMITIASLVFSMTLVALTTVSQQLGPRILMRFMDDRPTQMTLGLFLAAFLFSLIMLMQITSDGEAGEVSGVGVIAAAVLAIGALAGMIHFFDHVSKRIQADSIIAELGADLQLAATAFVDESADDAAFAQEGELDKLSEHFAEAGAVEISRSESGYLGPLSLVAIRRITSDKRIVLRMAARQNDFILAGSPICYAASSEIAGGEDIAEDLASKIAHCFPLYRKRTPEANVEFELSALVEVALRALSPGINDPFTARACIDRLADGLRVLALRNGDQRVMRDEGGVIRLAYTHEPLRRYLELSFDAIFDASANQRLVRSHLSERLRDLTGGTSNDDTRAIFAEYTRGLAAETAVSPGSRQADDAQPQRA